MATPSKKSGRPQSAGETRATWLRAPASSNDPSTAVHKRSLRDSLQCELPTSELGLNETPSPLGSTEFDDSTQSEATTGWLAPGSRFGGYLVSRCIGEGGMARIYQAEHAGLRRQVALKVLTDGFARHPDARERFLREARIAAAIKHPNVVNVFDVGVHQEVPYLVMELLDGQDLEQLLAAKGCLDEALLVDIMVPVVAGLIGVHEAGIVHRDLKPGNIFLVQGKYNEIQPKLLDFGISKALGLDQLKLTANRGFMGTPFYASPEGLQIGEITALSDQYSLGVVMYECATGVTPFQATTFPELFKLITAGNYRPPGSHRPELSRRLTRIIERAMSRDPKARFEDMREMGRELLLLSGQRTRITWGLTFGEPPNTAGTKGGGNAAKSSEGAPGNRPSSTRAPRRSRAALLAACVAAPWLLLCASFLIWRSGRPTGESIAHPSGAAGSAVTPASPRVGRAADTEAERAVEAQPVPSDVPAPVASVGDGERNGPKEAPARWQSALATGAVDKGVSPAREAPSPPATSAAFDQTAARTTSRTTAADGRSSESGAREPEPAWALPPVRTDSRDLPVGANRAPIFD